MKEDPKALKAEIRRLRQEKARLEHEVTTWRTRCLELQAAALPKPSPGRSPAPARLRLDRPAAIRSGGTFS